MNGFTHGYAVVIGVADYLHAPKLPRSVIKDAEDVYNLLRSPNHCGYVTQNMKLLLDEQATAENVRQGILWLTNVAQSEDICFLFFSGHGGRVGGINQGQAENYLIPYDCDISQLSKTAISGDELTTLLNNIRAKQLIVIFDSCYSGGTGEVKGLLKDIGWKSGLSDSYYERLASGRGRVIMASSRSDEVSLVLPGMDNSLFTAFFLRALQGQARTRGDGYIRVFDVFDYVSEEVPTHGAQHPIFKAHDLENNFALALHLGGEKQSIPTLNLPTVHTSVDKRVLREAMTRQFGLEELDVLCADVQQSLNDDGIDIHVGLEISGGNGKAAKILNLIQYLDRRGYLAYLVSFVRRERPGII